VDINDIELIAEVGWMPEKDLPEWVDLEVLRTLCTSCRFENDLREFPFIVLYGKQIMLRNPNAPSVPLPKDFLRLGHIEGEQT
jgi:hypothetical protein